MISTRGRELHQVSHERGRASSQPSRGSFSGEAKLSLSLKSALHVIVRGKRSVRRSVIEASVRVQIPHRSHYLLLHRAKVSNTTIGCTMSRLERSAHYTGKLTMPTFIALTLIDQNLQDSGSRLMAMNKTYLIAETGKMGSKRLASLSHPVARHGRQCGA